MSSFVEYDGSPLLKWLVLFALAGGFFLAFVLICGPTHFFWRFGGGALMQ